MMFRELKIWRLNKEPFTKTDYIWIKELGCDLTVHNPEPENITSASGTWQYYAAYYAAAPWIEIQTTCDKQQSMLQLKFGNLLYLIEHRVEVDGVALY